MASRSNHHSSRKRARGGTARRKSPQPMQYTARNLFRAKMADPRHEFGLAGERAAERILKRAGLKLLMRRFNTIVGEIDLVMREKDTIVFVEVKTRRDRRWSEPEDSVTPAKCKRLLAAA